MLAQEVSSLKDENVMVRVDPSHGKRPLLGRMKEQLLLGRVTLLDICGDETPGVNNGDIFISLMAIADILEGWFKKPSIALNVDYEIGDEKAFGCLEAVRQVLEGRNIKYRIFSRDEAVIAQANEFSNGKVETGLILPGDPLNAIETHPLDEIAQLGVKYLLVNYDPTQAKGLCGLAAYAMRAKKIKVWADANYGAITTDEEANALISSKLGLVINYG